MKKILLAIAMVLVISLASNAQEYTTGIGIRAGLSNGLTVKHFVKEKAAVEGILATRWGGFNITGLYEFHTNAFDTPGLNFFYGFGGHLGLWDGSKATWFSDNKSHMVLGVDGIVGLEYTLDAVPINFSLDWKPGFNLLGHSGFWGDELALSLRFVF